MIKKLTHFTLFVMDQDKAMDFYVNKLGFKVHTDATMDDGFRWLTINAPEQPEVELALIPATTEEERNLVGNQSAEQPLFYVSTDDCDKTYQEFRRHSVEVLQEPVERPWGKAALFVDLYGNIFGICQMK